MGRIAPPITSRDARALRLVAALRGRHLLLLDLIACALAAYAALCLAADRLVGPDVLGLTAPVLAILVASRAAANVALGLYRRRWRWASVPDLERIVAAAVLGSAVAVAVAYGGGLARAGAVSAWIPPSFWPVELLLSAAALGGARLGIRVIADSARPRVDPAGGGLPALLYGAGETGVQMRRWAAHTPSCGVLPVGFLDDDPALAGIVVAGLPVFGGIAALPGAILASGARLLLITMPSASGSAVRGVVEAATANGLEVRTVPALVDLLDGTIDAYRVRHVRVEDLLRRPMAVERAHDVESIVRDRTVLITGAAGSIGSELARQVHSLGPRRLVLVDRAESPLYLVQRELEGRAARGRGTGEIHVELHNIASRALMDRLIRQEAPDVILHAAAYKHVPMIEEHPSEAVQVNVGGTIALLDAAVAAGVERFVLVSTDKAVHPSCAMGATKRLAELLVADVARSTALRYVAVRFGNVLGSTGSVVPILQDELENARPLTITDPDMTRFFMTIPEAAWLILDAAALARRGGDLFVLDMGRPVRIMDLARDLVRLAGRDPDSQPIEFVGLRPGEKLHEELSYASERVVRTQSPKVLRLLTEPPPLSIRADASSLLQIALGDREAELRHRLMATIRRLDPIPVATPEAAPDANPSALAAVAASTGRTRRAMRGRLPSPADAWKAPLEGSAAQPTGASAGD